MRRVFGGTARYARILATRRGIRGGNVCMDRNQPLTRPGRLATAPPQATLSPGRGLWDRVFVLREKKMNAPPCSKSCSWLSAVAGRPLFSSTFPVRSLLFSEPARRRGRACPTLVVTSGNAGGTPGRPLQSYSPATLTPPWMPSAAGCGHSIRCTTIIRYILGARKCSA